MTIGLSHLLLKTKKFNYLYSVGLSSVIHISPLLKAIIANRNYLSRWVDNVTAKSGVSISGVWYGIDQVEYQLEKYEFLKKHNYFEIIGEKTTRNKRLSGKKVETLFQNTSSISFELTESCNMKCKYCGYGELYERQGLTKRSNKKMKFEEAKTLIDFYKSRIKGKLDKKLKSNKIFNIGFYGGEPLLEFSTIKQIVEYVNKIKIPERKIQFSMTTNAILLDKYMDYLVVNNFRLAISLDGDKKANSLRVDHKNKQSFDKVYSNIKLLKKRYPDFFKTSVNILSVLHSANSHSEIYSYIEKEFEIEPKILPLSTDNINISKFQEFKKIWHDPSVSYNNYLKSFRGAIPFHKDSSAYMLSRYSLGLSFQIKFKDKNFMTSNKPSFLSGTCLPFFKEIFMTADGNLCYCERIPAKYSLGKVMNNKVYLDFDKIAKGHNNIYDLMSSKCYTCYRINYCRECLLTDNNLGECNYYSRNKELVKNEIANMIDYIEKDNIKYLQSIKEIMI